MCDRFYGGGPFCLLHPWRAPKKPILNRVKETCCFWNSWQNYHWLSVINTYLVGGDTSQLGYESMKYWESKQLAGYIFACFIALAPSLTLLAGFALQSLLALSLCQLASTKEGIFLEYSCAWQQLRTRHKNLVRQGWRYYCFLTSFSCYSHRPIVPLWTRAQSDNIRHKVD